MEENAINIKNAIYKLTNRPIAMNEGKYIYFDTLSIGIEEVTSEILKEAEVLAKAELDKKILNDKITEYQAYLNKTDYKFFNGYKPKDGEDLFAIEAKRDEYREFIRSNGVM